MFAHSNSFKSTYGRPWTDSNTLLACPGYTEGLDLVLRNQNEIAKARVGRRQKQRTRTESPDTSSSLTSPSPKFLPESEEAHSLCFFISSWVDYSPDAQATRDVIGLVPLLYPRAKSGSPLSLCIAAISHLVFNKWEHRIQQPETLPVIAIHSKALAATRIALQDPILSMTDDTLMAVCMLGWYEACAEALNAKISSPRHYEGAAALITQRRGHLMSDTAKRMLVGIRSNLAYRAIQTTSPIDVNADVWQESYDLPHTPASLLDTLIVEVANTLAQGYSTPDRVSVTGRDDTVIIENPTILSRAKKLDADLAEWSKVIPAHWIPVPVSKDYLPVKVINAGLYAQTCDIYHDVIVCATWNDWRIARLNILALIARCTNGEERANAIKSIQELADAICASIPFCLGSRTTPAPLHAADITYPTLPGQEVKKLHYRTAAAYGGWYLFAPMKQVAAVRMYLREGQATWVKLQLRRLAAIYDIIPQM